MLDFSKADVIRTLENDLKRVQKETENSYSDLGYWSALSKREFIKANLKYLNEQAPPS